MKRSDGARGCPAPPRPARRRARASSPPRPRRRGPSSAPSALSVPANTLVAGRLVDRHRLAGDRRPRRRSTRPSTTTPSSGDALAGPHHEARADGRPRRPATGARSPSVGHDARLRGRELHQRVDRPAAAVERHRSPASCRPRTAPAPTRPRRRRRSRPRRPRRAPSARSCPASGGAARPARRGRSASRRRPSTAGTAARRPRAARPPATRPRATASSATDAVVESARASRRQNGATSASLASPRRPARAIAGARDRRARRASGATSPVDEHRRRRRTTPRRRGRRPARRPPSRPSARTPRSPCRRRGSARAARARDRVGLGRRRPGAIGSIGSSSRRAGPRLAEHDVDAARGRRSVSAYMTILPSRRERTSPAARSARTWCETSFSARSDDPRQVAHAQLALGVAQRHSERQPRRVGQRLGRAAAASAASSPSRRWRSASAFGRSRHSRSQVSPLMTTP